MFQKMTTGKFFSNLAPLILLVLFTIPKNAEADEIRVCRRRGGQTTTTPTVETTTPAATTTTVEPTTTVPHCRDTYATFGSNNYKLKADATAVLYPAAKAACEAEGARPVVIKDAAMQTAADAAAAAAGVSAYWIGLENQAVWQWKWLDDTVLNITPDTHVAADGTSYENFQYSSQANGGSEPCCNSRSSVWYDIECDDPEYTYGWVCECLG